MENLADGRPPAWGKIALLRSLLQQYDLLLWIDADAIFVDITSDITQLVTPDNDLYLVEHPLDISGEMRAANTGVMLLRATPWTERLLRRIWENHAFIHHEWWENAALLDVLGYEPADEPMWRPPGPNDGMERVELVDASWNSITARHVDRARIRHHGGLSIAERRELMLDDLLAFRRTLWTDAETTVRPSERTPQPPSEG